MSEHLIPGRNAVPLPVLCLRGRHLDRRGLVVSGIDRQFKLAQEQSTRTPLWPDQSVPNAELVPGAIRGRTENAGLPPAEAERPQP